MWERGGSSVWGLARPPRLCWLSLLELRAQPALPACSQARSCRPWQGNAGSRAPAHSSGGCSGELGHVGSITERGWLLFAGNKPNFTSRERVHQPVWDPSVLFTQKQGEQSLAVQRWLWPGEHLLSTAAGHGERGPSSRARGSSE